jgi:hypothetical protein
MSLAHRTDRRRLAFLCVVSVLAAAPGSAAAGVSSSGAVKERPGPRVAALFDPASRETRVTARVEGLCVALDLPLAWTLDPDAAAPEAALSAHLQDADGLALDLVLRPVRTLPPGPGVASRNGALPAGDALARRAAGAIQSDYEGFLGRPAQSVTFKPLGSGSLRWTATWLDSQLPSGSGALTVDAAILPLSSDWVLELSLSGTENPPLHEAVLGAVVGRVRSGRHC